MRVLQILPSASALAATLLELGQAVTAADTGESITSALWRGGEVTLHLHSGHVDRLNPGNVQRLASAIGS